MVRKFFIAFGVLGIIVSTVMIVICLLHNNSILAVVNTLNLGTFAISLVNLLTTPDD